MSTKKVKVELLFGANTQAAQAELKKLSDSLENIRKRPPIGAGDMGFQKAAEAAEWLERSLRSAVDVNTGKLNLNKFSQDLNTAGKNLEGLHRDLKRAGLDGENAFKQLAKSIALADTATLSVNDKLKEVFKTLKNTARWEISSKVLHTLESALSNSYRYAQDLNKSLNDIRIVTGYNTDQMAKFAKEANLAAKALSSTTTDYTKASLIYYQQGLSDSEVIKRTNTTVKMAQVVGSTAEKTSDQLTAVWNNFYDGSKSIEYYADVMTALGAATASSTDEISAGLNKFASVANTVGLSYEYAASALATVTATTRESADVVGTAFKTLFARIQDLELGNTLDDGTTLGKYSQALAKVGIDIKDTNDEIKTMDVLLTEIAAKWQELSEGDQIALAESVAGTRQYTQLIALMNNWEFFQENLNTSLTSTGTLDEQAKIYAESWEAAEKRVTASAEAIYGKILDDDTFIELTNLFANFIDSTGDLIDGLGGVKGLLSAIGTIFVAKFAKDVPDFMRKTISNIKVITGFAEKEKIAMIQDSSTALRGGWNEKTKTYNKSDDQLTSEEKRLIELNDVTIKYLQNKRKYSEYQQKEIEARLDNMKSLHDEITAYEKAGKEAESFVRKKKQSIITTYTTNIDATNEKKELELRNKEAKVKAKYYDASSQVSLASGAVGNTKKRITTLRNKVTQGTASEDETNELNRLENEELPKLEQALIQTQDLLKKAKQDIQDAGQELANFISNLDNIDIDSLSDEAKTSLEDLQQAIEESVKASSKLDTISKNIDTLISTDDITELKEYKEELKKLLELGKDFNLSQQTQNAINQAIASNSIEDAKAILIKNKDDINKELTNIIDEKQDEAIEAEATTTKLIGDRVEIGKFTEVVTTNAQGKYQKDYLEDSLRNKTKNALDVGNKTAIDRISQGLTHATSTATGAIAAFSAVNGVWETMEDTSATTGEKITALGGGLMSLIPTITSLIATMGPWGAAIAAIGAAIAVGAKLWDNYTVTTEEKLEAATQRVEEFAQASKEAANKAEDIASAYDNYISVIDTLNSCVRGTTEWKNALTDVQNQSQALLDLYPELLKMADLYVYDSATGQYIIDPKKLKEAKEEAEKQAAFVSTASNMANLSVLAAREEDEYSKLLKSIYAFDEFDIISPSGKKNDGVNTFGKNIGVERTQNFTSKIISLVQQGMPKDDIKEEVEKYLPTLYKTSNNRLTISDQKAFEKELDLIITRTEKLVSTQDEIAQTSSKTMLEYAKQFSLGELGTLSLTSSLMQAEQGEWSAQEVVDKWQANGLKFNGDILGANENEIRYAVEAYMKANNLSKSNKTNWLRAADGGKIFFETADGKNKEVSLLDIAEYARTTGIQNITDINSEEVKIAKEIEKLEDKQRDLTKAILSETSGINTQAIEDYISNFIGDIEDINEIYNDLDDDIQQHLENLGFDIADLSESYEQIESSLNDQLKDNSKLGKRIWLDTGKQFGTKQDVVDMLVASNEDLKDLSVGQQLNLANIYEKLFEYYGEFANHWIGQVTAENYEELAQAGEQLLDIATISTFEGLQLYEEYLASTETLTEEQKKSALENAQNIQQIADITSDSIEAQAAQINEIVGEGLAYGDILSEADINTLKKNGLEIDKYFDRLEDGTYQLNGGIDNFEGNMESIAKAIDECNQAIKHSTIDEYAKLLEDYDKAREQALDLQTKENQQNNQEYYNLAFLSSFNADSLTAAGIDVDTQNLIKNNVIKNDDGTIKEIKTEELTDEQKEALIKAVKAIGQLDQQNQIKIGRQAVDYNDLDRIRTDYSFDTEVYNYLRAEMEKNAEAFELTKFEEIVDIYADIADELGYINNELAKANKYADNLYGDKRINQLKEIDSLYQKEIDALEKKQSIIDNQLAKAKSALQEHQIKVEGVDSINIDESTGLVTNQYDILNQLWVKLNETETAFKAAGAVEGTWLAGEVERLKKEYETFKQYVDNYEQLYNDSLENVNAYQDAIIAKMDNHYESLVYEVEINLEINELDLKELDYYLNKVSDDFYSMSEAISYMVDNKSGNKLDILKDALNIYDDKYSLSNGVLGGSIVEARRSGNITQEKYISDLKESYNAILDNLQSLNELDKEMMAYYGETLSKANEELDKYTSRMDSLTKVLDHYKNVLNIVGKEQDYKAMGAVLEGTAKHLKNVVDVSRKEYEMFAAEEAEMQARLNTVAENDSRYDLYKKEWEAAEEAMREAQDSMLSATEEWAEAMKATVENELSGLADTLEKALTGGISFDELSQSMERASSLQEEYLTATNQIYETTKLMRTAQNAIDSTTNSVAKEKFKNYINETKQLQNQTKLSQYELDIQQAKYDLLLAEIALQDAQNAKTTVRLTRDAEGNFGYVYTADQNKVNDAQQKFEDAQNKLYNIGLEGANEYTEKYQQAMSAMYDELTELQTAYLNGEITTQEEYNRRQNEIQQYYYEKLKNYSSLYQVALTTDSRVVADAWSTDFADMTYNTEEWMAHVNDYVGQTKEVFIDWQETIDAIEQEVDADFENMETAVKDVTTESDKLAKEIQGDVVPALTEEINSISAVTAKYAEQRNEIEKQISYYERLASAIGDAIKAQDVFEGTEQFEETPDYSLIMIEEVLKGKYNSTLYENAKIARRSKIEEKGLTSADGIIESKDFEYLMEKLNYYYNKSIDHDVIDEKDHMLLRYMYEVLQGNRYLNWDDAVNALNMKQFASGGYTGAWGPEGKLAILDEKELVLNSEDTTNFLASLDLLHDIIRMIDVQAASTQVGGILSSSAFGYGAAGTLEQSVHIEASFPGVTDRTEIEEAFNNLVNRASQYANRK